MALDVDSASTPVRCIADFCIIPIGTSSPSVSAEIAMVQQLLQSKAPRAQVQITMHSAGTTLEGSWQDVMNLIGQAHALLHEHGVLRVQTDIRVGTRTDKAQTAADKVRVVEEILAEHKKV